jgi:hypothetical protein
MLRGFDVINALRKGQASPWRYEDGVMGAKSNALGSQTKYWRRIGQDGRPQEAIDRLTAEQRRVTQEAGTELPFTGGIGAAA